MRAPACLCVCGRALEFMRVKISMAKRNICSGFFLCILFCFYCCSLGYVFARGYNLKLVKDGFVTVRCVADGHKPKSAACVSIYV